MRLAVWDRDDTETLRFKSETNTFPDSPGHRKPRDVCFQFRDNENNNWNIIILCPTSVQDIKKNLN